jgi:hypothetical protein
MWVLDSADGLAELDRHRPDTARPPVHQQRLTGPQVASLKDIGPWEGTPMGLAALRLVSRHETAVYLPYGRSDYIPPNSRGYCEPGCPDG